MSEEKLAGAIIKDVRRLSGIPRAEVAQRLGVAEAVVGGWEQGAGTYERWLPLALIGLLDLAMNRELGFPTPALEVQTLRLHAVPLTYAELRRCVEFIESGAANSRIVALSGDR